MLRGFNSIGSRRWQRQRIGSFAALVLSSGLMIGPGFAAVGVQVDEREKTAVTVEDRMTGSQMTIQDASRKCDMIIIAKDVDMGSTDPDFLGKAYYDNVKLKVARSLKGDAKGEFSSVRVMIRTLPSEVAEATPVEGQEYVFFLEENPDRKVIAIKVLRATDENIRATLEVLGE